MFSVNFLPVRLSQIILVGSPPDPDLAVEPRGAVTGDVEFQDDRVVDHPVDGRGRGHGVGEDVLLLGEDQVGRDAQGPAFVAFGDEGEEQHLRLLGTLGQVAQVVEEQEVEVVRLAQPPVRCGRFCLGGHRLPFHPVRRAPSPVVSGNQPSSQGSPC